jgi:hypothetical protein
VSNHKKLWFKFSLEPVSYERKDSKIILARIILFHEGKDG